MRKLKKLSKKTKIIISVLVLSVICFIGGCVPDSEFTATGTTENTNTAIVETTAESNINENDPEEEKEVTHYETESVKENAYNSEANTETDKKLGDSNGTPEVSVSSVPDFKGVAYVVINGNQPDFSHKEITTSSFEKYSPLDYLGRCGVAFACLGRDIMPTEERGGIGQVKPSGWHTIKYDCVDGKYLYNRCHLIGFQLSGENANERNLITGTRYMNVDGMLPFENMVADYIKETDNHVMYRVTPVYDGKNLLASGVQIEAYSVEDDGDGICFNVYCYNAQPGVKINYSDGSSKLSGKTVNEVTTKKNETTSDKSSVGVVAENSSDSTTKKQQASSNSKYILNTNSKKFHYPSCGSVKKMSEENKSEYKGSREDLLSKGYVPCKNCDP